MEKFVVIVAGGSGTRMGTETPKQFIELCGKPILMHTITAFYKYDSNCKIIVVLPENQLSFWDKLRNEYRFEIAHQVVAGGQTRFHSVLNGLSAIEGDGIVFIHDGARPLVSTATIERCYSAAHEQGNAIPVLPVDESLRQTRGDDSISVDRGLYRVVQTPQTFRTEQIMKAFEQDYLPAFTDDASVAEKAGFWITMVEGNRENIKITNPFDMIVARAILENKAT